MADHVVSVIYQAKVAQYRADVQKAAEENRTLGKTSQETADKTATSWGRAGNSLGGVKKGAAATSLALGVMFTEWDAGADALAAKTGATGDLLDQLTDSFDKVGASGAYNLQQVGDVMGEVYARTKLTDEPLERLTRQILDLGKLGQEVDAEQLTASLTKAGVPAREMADTLDTMYRVSTTTGTSVSTLSGIYEQFGVQLKATGLPLEDQLLLLGELEAGGVNTTKVLSGMNRAVTDIAKAGGDPAEGLGRLVDQIKATKSDGDAAAIAAEAFGNKAGPELAAAIRSGRLDLDQYRAALDANSTSIHDAARGTYDLVDYVKQGTNAIAGQLGPMSQWGSLLTGVVAVSGPAAKGVDKLAGAARNSAIAERLAAGGAQALGTDAAGLTRIMAGAATGVTAAAGAVAAWAAIMAQARAEGGQFVDRVHDQIFATKSLDDNLAAVNRGLSSIAAQRASANDNPLEGFVNQDLLASLDAAGDGLERYRDLLDRGRLAIDDLSDAYGISKDAADRWISSFIAGGGTFDTTADLVAAYRDEVLTTTDAQDTAADSTLNLADRRQKLIDALADEAHNWDANREAMERYNDALRGQFDPIFKLQSAYANQRDAQARYNELVASGTATAAELSDAQYDLLQAALDVTTATNDFNGSMKDNPEAMQASIDAIGEWEAQGLLTKTQADNLRVGLYLLGLQAAETDKQSVDIAVRADGTQALETLRQVKEGIEGLAGTGVGINTVINFPGLNSNPSTVSAAPAPATPHHGPKTINSTVNIYESRSPTATANEAARALRRAAIEAS